MTRYTRWTAADAELLPGLVEEWTEIDADGVVTRELGFDDAGDIAHQFPSEHFPQGRYGTFDLAIVEVEGLKDIVEPAEFDRKWEQALRETEGRARPPDALDRMIARLLRPFRGSS